MDDTILSTIRTLVEEIARSHEEWLVSGEPTVPFIMDNFRVSISRARASFFILNPFTSPVSQLESEYNPKLPQSILTRVPPEIQHGDIGMSTIQFSRNVYNLHPALSTSLFFGVYYNKFGAAHGELLEAKITVYNRMSVNYTTGKSSACFPGL